MQSWWTNSVINLSGDGIYSTLCSALRIALINVKTHPVRRRRPLPLLLNADHWRCFLVLHLTNKRRQPQKPARAALLLKARKLLSFLSSWYWVKRGHPTRPASSPFSPRAPEAAHLADAGGGSQRADAVSAPDSLFIYKLPALFSSPLLLFLLFILLLCVWHNKRKSFSRLQATVCNFRSL